MPLSELQPMMTLAAALFAVGAAIILVWFLIKKPPLTSAVKVVLLFGFGVLPIGAAGTTNIAGFEHTTEREFCGTCHVMTEYAVDSENPLSHSLAARHARNETFGPHNCYECHKDYGAYSTILTKWGGMMHVWYYYTEYHAYSIPEAREKIHLRKPYLNAACMRCHSTEVPTFAAVADHGGLMPRLRGGEVSCVSSGCHGPAHPFSKKPAHGETP